MKTIILNKKNPNEFKTRKIKITKKGPYYYFEPIGKNISFKKMQESRKDINQDKIKENINKEGHIFANLGISALITINIEKEIYLLLIKHQRKDFNDCVNKMISGYISSDYLSLPISTLEEEISEEFLPLIQDNEIIRLNINGNVRRPFSDRLIDSQFFFIAINKSYYNLPNLENFLYLNNKKKLIYFNPLKNSAQLVYPIHLTVNDIIKKRKISFHGCEDYFNKEKNILEVRLNPYTISLIKLERGLLTDKIFLLKNGKLIKRDSLECKLSEAFTLNNNSMTTANNINLLNFINR